MWLTIEIRILQMHHDIPESDSVYSVRNNNIVKLNLTFRLSTTHIHKITHIKTIVKVIRMKFFPLWILRKPSWRNFSLFTPAFRKALFGRTQNSALKTEAQYSSTTLRHLSIPFLTIVTFHKFVWLMYSNLKLGNEYLCQFVQRDEVFHVVMEN